jgi:hypothetical protein
MLTQLNTLKARLGIDLFDTQDDVLLTNFILLCTGRFEQECNRKFERAANDTYEFSASKMEIIPPRYPIESVASFHLKSRESDGWILQSAVDYLLRLGHVISLDVGLGSENEQARVTYTGGYVLPGTDPEAGQTALPAEIEQACLEQCVHWYQNRTRLGISSISDASGSIATAKLDLLPIVSPVLGRHERWVM